MLLYYFLVLNVTEKKMYVIIYIMVAIAVKYLKLKSPASYRIRKHLAPHHLKNGMSYAFGGTGVFETLYPGPNMTTQINFFQKAIQDKVFTTSDITQSVALVSVAGNDYTRYTATNGSIQVHVFCLLAMIRIVLAESFLRF